LHEVESILDREVCRLCDELSTPLTVKAAVLNESEDAPEQAS
jgi:hypothetical protein